MKMNQIAYLKMRCNPAKYYDNRVLDLNLERLTTEDQIDNTEEKISDTTVIKGWRKLRYKLCFLIDRLESIKVKIRRAKRLKAEE